MSDDDDIASAWEAELESGGSGLSGDDLPESSESGNNGGVPFGTSLGAERILSQDEIDALLGFSKDAAEEAAGRGVRAMMDTAMVSYERLPMLEVVFERLVRLMTTSLRNFTSENVEVSLETMNSVRFGDYLNSIPLPAVLAVFESPQLDNSGLVTVDSALVYAMVDVLLGGKGGGSVVRADGRPYTRIERNLISELINLVLTDTSTAFTPVTALDFVLDRVESNPRFATVSQPSDAAILVGLRVDMDDRGGCCDLVFPYATLEPIRELLLQNFMGEKFGNDAIWENHLAAQLWSSQTELQVVLDEFSAPLGKLMTIEPGETLMMSASPETRAILTCGDIRLARGRIGRVGHSVALRIEESIRERKSTNSAQGMNHAL